MEYTPYTLLTDVGWISVLLLAGKLLRVWVTPIQRLMIPSSMTAGLLGIALGPYGLDWIPFSDQLGTYSSILIAVVFAAIPFNESFGLALARGARAMWSYSVAMYVLQWGLALLFAFTLIGLLWSVPSSFGLMLPAGWAGGFGTAAAVGDVMSDEGWQEATTLGFTSATVGSLVAIIGGLTIAKWGAVTGRTQNLARFDALPDEMRHGLVREPDEQAAIGRATSSPSSIESLALHAALLSVVTYGGYLVSQGVAELFPSVVVPTFIAAFLVGIVCRSVIGWTGAEPYVDATTVRSLSGAGTDLLVAFGIASIVPSIVADYVMPLAVLFVFGLAYCLVMFRFVTPRMFEYGWLERGLFTWGWSTAAVSTGIALLRVVDPKGKSKTIEEFGLAYIGFAPIEIAMVVVAPMLVLQGFGWAFIGGCLVLGFGVLAAAFVFGWSRSSSPVSASSINGG